MKAERQAARGSGRGQGRRRQLRRFLQPCLLLLIQRGASHGYQLQADLEAFGFNPERLDVSMVYRALREMEAEGWLESHWDEASEGPRRRVYVVTHAGQVQLTWFIDELRRTRRNLDCVIAAYEAEDMDG